MYVYLYILVYLRRGGMKASAFFLTRGGLVLVVGCKSKTWERSTHLPQNDVAGNETATENVSKWCRCCHLCHLCRYQWLTAPRHRSAPWRKVLATVAKSKPKTSWIPCTAILQMWQHRILVWNEKLSRNNSGTLGMDLPALWCILLHSLMFFGPILISSRYHSTLLLRFTSFTLSPGL